MLSVSLSELSVVSLVSVETVTYTDSVKELVSLLLPYDILVTVFKSAVGLRLVIRRRRAVSITCLASWTFAWYLGAPRTNKSF